MQNSKIQVGFFPSVPDCKKYVLRKTQKSCIFLKVDSFLIIYITDVTLYIKYHGYHDDALHNKNASTDSSSYGLFNALIYNFCFTCAFLSCFLLLWIFCAFFNVFLELFLCADFSGLWVCMWYFFKAFYNSAFYREIRGPAGLVEKRNRNCFDYLWLTVLMCLIPPAPEQWGLSLCSVYICTHTHYQPGREN